VPQCPGYSVGMTISIQHRLLGLSGLAQELRLPRDWLRGEAIAGRLPCLRIGRRFLFDLEAVRCALAQQAAASRAISQAD
jgi:hypothetical protein